MAQSIIFIQIIFPAVVASDVYVQIRLKLPEDEHCSSYIVSMENCTQLFMIMLHNWKCHDNIIHVNYKTKEFIAMIIFVAE